MQTFLPFESFIQSARVLDYRRLGKQRVEAMQLINILDNVAVGKGWRNHPALKQWIGYTDALKLYHNIIVLEWINRGYKNNMPLYDLPEKIKLPPWIGHEPFHYSHRCRLMQKDVRFYSQYNWEFPTDYTKEQYHWPI